MQRTIRWVLMGVFALPNVLVADPPAPPAVASSVELLKPSNSPLEALPAAKQAEFVGVIDQMLTAAQKPVKAAQEDVRKHFTKADKICESEPRLAHAYGLALLKQGQTADGMTQLGRARKLASDEFLPARQAEIRIQIGLKQYDEAIAAMQAVAESLAQTRTVPLADQDQQDIADWLGRVSAYLDGAAGSSQDFKERTARVRAGLPVKLQAAFDQGHRVATDKVASLTAEIRVSLEKDAADHKQEAEAKKDAAEKDIATATTAITKANDSATEVTEKVTKEFARLDGIASGLQTRLDKMGVELDQTRDGMQRIDRQADVQFSAPKNENPRDMAKRLRDKENFRNNAGYGRLLQRERDLIAQGNGAQRELGQNRGLRKQVEQQGNQALSRLQNDVSNAKKLGSTATQRQKVAEKSLEKKTVEHSAHTRDLENKRGRLDTFAPWDFATEAARLVQSFRK